MEGEEYIEREALKVNFAAAVPYVIDSATDMAYADGLITGYSLLLNAPAVDAEPVVRCADCKYNSGAWRGGVWCKVHHSGMHYNDYCSRGRSKCQPELQSGI